MKQHRIPETGQQFSIEYKTTASIQCDTQDLEDLQGLGWAEGEENVCITEEQLRDAVDSLDNPFLNAVLNKLDDGVGDITFYK